MCPASEETNWSGSALFVIQYVNLYQQSGFKAPYSSKIDILLSKKGLINWYVYVIA